MGRGGGRCACPPMRRPRRRNPSRRDRRLTPRAPPVGRGAEPAAAIGPAFCPALHVDPIFASRSREQRARVRPATTRAKFRVSPGPFCRPNLPCIRWTLSGGGRAGNRGRGERASRRLHGPLEERARRASYSLCRRPSTCPRTDLLSRAAASTRTARCVYARPPVHSRERVTTHRGLSRSVRTVGGR